LRERGVQKLKIPMPMRTTAMAMKRGPTAAVILSAARSTHLKHRNTARVIHIFRARGGSRGQGTRTGTAPSIEAKLIEIYLQQEFDFKYTSQRFYTNNRGKDCGTIGGCQQKRGTEAWHGFELRIKGNHNSGEKCGYM